MRLLLTGLLLVFACAGETRFYVDQRGDYANGKNFGTPGIYEIITARIVTDAGEGRAEVLKPRDPKLGSGTLILDVDPSSKGRLSVPESALASGQTFVRLAWPNAATLPAGVHEVLEFLKYKGGPMLLGDQSRFLKRAYLVDRGGAWLREFAASDKNKESAKGRTLADGVLRGAAAKTYDASAAQPLSN